MLRHIGNYFLAVSLLAATMGFRVSEHHCMGRVMDIAINQHADTCTEGDKDAAMPCCEDTQEDLRIEEITKVSFDFDAQTSLYALYSIDFLLVFDEQLPIIHHQYWHLENTSHFPDIDFQSTLQVYLI